MNFWSLVFIYLLTIEKSWACVGCGQESYTPKMLLAGSLFALLPMGLVGFVIWVLRKEMKANKKDGSHITD